MTGLADRFLATARRYADNTALITSDIRLTYGELRSQAEALAAELTEMRIDDGAPVAVRVARTHASLVAILGTILTGHPYVPIDARYPPQREELMLADCSPAACIDGSGSTPVIRERSRNPAFPPIPPDTLYVIYTSGSTGPPKGCVVTNHNVLSLFDTSTSLFSFGSLDITSAIHSLAFDFSVWELWSAWLYGGAVWAATSSQLEDPGELVGALRQQCVTRLSATPSLFGHLVREIRRQGTPLPALRSVVLGGEAVRVSDVTLLLASDLTPNANVINMYGITETTIHVTHKVLSKHSAAASDGATPIGIPLPSAHVSLRADNSTEVADGELGEIWVSGAGVCAGYLGRPELTAARFHTSQDGRRWYRSGDLARTEDGELYYVGRNDRQVQLRGFRIELGEVEEALSNLPEVDRAVVCVEERGRGRQPVLVAHVRLHSTASSDAVAGLRQAVSRSLPPQAVPQFIRAVSDFPLTVNGKIDVQRLKAL